MADVEIVGTGKYSGLNYKRSWFSARLKIVRKMNEWILEIYPLNLGKMKPYVTIKLKEGILKTNTVKNFYCIVLNNITIFLKDYRCSVETVRSFSRMLTNVTTPGNTGVPLIPKTKQTSPANQNPPSSMGNQSERSNHLFESPKRPHTVFPVHDTRSLGGFYGSNKKKFTALTSTGRWSGGDLFKSRSKYSRLHISPSTCRGLFVEDKRADSVNSFEKGETERKTVRILQTSNNQDELADKGFLNLGNTCYMNAILQPLFALDSFTSDLLALNRKFRHSDLSIKKDKLFYTLGNLLKAKRSRQSDVQHYLLRKLKKIISSKTDQFVGYEQQDAHEFLSLILDTMKEEVDELNRKLSSENDVHRLEVPLLPDEEPISSIMTNPTSQNFEFQVLHTIHCKKCWDCISKVETCYDLALDLPETKLSEEAPSIQNALDSFLKSEDIEHKCEKCDHLQARLSHEFSCLPRVLVLHLKRYKTDEGKLGKFVHIPSYISPAQNCSEDTRLPQPWFKSNPGANSPVSEDEVEHLNHNLNQCENKENMLPSTSPVMVPVESKTNSQDLNSVVPSVSSSCTSKSSSSDAQLVTSAVEQDDLQHKPLTKNQKTPSKCSPPKALMFGHQESPLKMGYRTISDNNGGMEEEEALRRAMEESLKDVENFHEQLDGNLVTHESFKRNDVEKSDLAFPYKLASVVCHLGFSSTCGHYVSDVYDLASDAWMTYNDRKVKPTSEVKVRQERGRTGYLFFYVSEL